MDSANSGETWLPEEGYDLRQLAAALAAFALILSLAGCGAKQHEDGHDHAPAERLPWDEEAQRTFIVQQEPIPASKQMEGKSGVIRVALTDRGFRPAELTAGPGDVVRIYVKNTGERPHNLVLPRFNVFTSNLSAGADTYIEFTADAPGQWPFFSDAPAGDGKAEPGFTGTLKVE